jgi:hypothetical protein
MRDRSLDTGHFDARGNWQRFQKAEKLQTGPSPFPLLILAMLIALILLFRPEGPRSPNAFGTNLPGVIPTVVQP